MKAFVRSTFKSTPNIPFQKTCGRPLLKFASCSALQADSNFAFKSSLGVRFQKRAETPAFKVSSREPLSKFVRTYAHRRSGDKSGGEKAHYVVTDCDWDLHYNQPDPTHRRPRTPYKMITGIIEGDRAEVIPYVTIRGPAANRLIVRQGVHPAAAARVVHGSTFEIQEHFFEGPVSTLSLLPEVVMREWRERSVLRVFIILWMFEVSDLHLYCPITTRQHGPF